MNQKKSEARAFLFLTVALAPVLSVAMVGGYRFLIWIYQMMTGLPGA